MSRDSLDKLLDWMLIAALIGTVIVLVWMLGGCSSDGKLFGFLPTSGGGEKSSDPTDSNHQLRWALAPLAATATLALVGGLILLFVTRGQRGWIPVALGVSLAIVNVIVILAVRSWILWAVLAITTIVSVAAGVYSWRRTQHVHNEECRKWAMETPAGSASSDGQTLDSPSPDFASDT